MKALQCYSHLEGDLPNESMEQISVKWTTRKCQVFLSIVSSILLGTMSEGNGPFAKSLHYLSLSEGAWFFASGNMGGKSEKTRS
jgi:hypothetical protein